jgi:hypothetical protein
VFGRCKCDTHKALDFLTLRFGTRRSVATSTCLTLTRSAGRGGALSLYSVLPPRKNCGKVVARILTSLPKLTSLTILCVTNSVTCAFSTHHGCIRLTGPSAIFNDLQMTFLPLLVLQLVSLSRQPVGKF